MGTYARSAPRRRLSARNEARGSSGNVPDPLSVAGGEVVGLLLRYDPGEQVLRSVGDMPNGTLVLAVAGDALSFGVSNTWEPPSVTHGLRGTMMVPGGLDLSSVELVSVEEVVGACRSTAVALCLWETARLACQQAVSEMSAFACGLEALARAAGFAARLYAALRDAGFIVEEGSG